MLIGLSTGLIILLFLIDQWIKHTVVATIALGGMHTVVPGVLSLTYIRNDGAAWSMLAGQQWFFLIISVAALAIMIWFLVRYRHHWQYDIGLAFMIAGTLGNFYDRLINGFVVDMFQLDFINFPIFNFADTCLTVGVIWIMVVLFLEDRAEAHHA
ncbi:lipoprotein signal peptidase [Secundilactobacillus pentosiphilus]|uniref:Lipoprotein signal peptidase n=1 Tax=Secundilactobacillus pentosiphilus TaxID=1714682 RepID=A0A1Z5IM13_9LACO|nr:lipoprotein signal peptidase [Secundilactobacillus pentosiphilus]GAX05528.1 lipoprotein signal peptidase [Secundilactobacillus pentosiphilus]